MRILLLELPNVVDEIIVKAAEENTDEDVCNLVAKHMIDDRWEEADFTIILDGTLAQSFPIDVMRPYVG